MDFCKTKLFHLLVASIFQRNWSPKRVFWEAKFFSGPGCMCFIKVNLVLKTNRLTDRPNYRSDLPSLKNILDHSKLSKIRNWNTSAFFCVPLDYRNSGIPKIWLSDTPFPLTWHPTFYKGVLSKIQRKFGSLSFLDFYITK